VLIKARARPGHRSTYWWTEEIGDLRREAMRARNPAGIAALLESLRTARRRLGQVIKKAKAGAWKELVEDLDRDPWGRPYRIVLNKLRGGGPRITETLDPRLVVDIVDTLFPKVTSRGNPVRYVPPHLGIPPWKLPGRVGGCRREA